MADNKVLEHQPNRVAEEAAAANRTPTEKQVADAKLAEQLGGSGHKPLVISGRPGGAFNIDGSGFGTSGVVTIGGRMIPTTSWRDHSVRGQLPADVTEGAVIVQTAGGGTQTGSFPHKVPAAVSAAAAVAK